MCHHIDVREWKERPADEWTTDAEDQGDEDAETPEFLEEEPATEVDLLTDGGGEE